MPCVHGVYGFCFQCHGSGVHINWPASWTPIQRVVLTLTCSGCRRFFPHELVGAWQDEPLPVECGACVRAREEKNELMLRAMVRDAEVKS